MCLDMGSFHLWIARHLYSFRPRQILISNGQQTLGVALPWAIARVRSTPFAIATGSSPRPLGRAAAPSERHRAIGTPLSRGLAPNELWCTDFKGEFKLDIARYRYPLTVTDHASRLCEALESTREDLAITAFERLFRERGLPNAKRSSNRPASMTFSQNSIPNGRTRRSR